MIINERRGDVDDDEFLRSHPLCQIHLLLLLELRNFFYSAWHQAPSFIFCAIITHSRRRHGHPWGLSASLCTLFTASGNKTRGRHGARVGGRAHLVIEWISNSSLMNEIQSPARMYCRHPHFLIGVCVTLFLICIYEWIGE